jgi:hypothetical protein
MPIVLGSEACRELFYRKSPEYIRSVIGKQPSK